MLVNNGVGEKALQKKTSKISQSWLREVGF